jgi:hypothetical protein
MTGIITTFVSVTTPMSPTAEFSSTTTTSIALLDFMEPKDFTGVLPASEVLVPQGTASRHHTPSLACIPAHSAALIGEECQEDLPLAGSRASEEAFMAVEVSTAVGAEVAGNSRQSQKPDDDTEKNSCAQII